MSSAFLVFLWYSPQFGSVFWLFENIKKSPDKPFISSCRKASRDLKNWIVKGYSGYLRGIFGLSSMSYLKEFSESFIGLSTNSAMNCQA